MLFPNLGMFVKFAGKGSVNGGCKDKLSIHKMLWDIVGGPGRPKDPLFGTSRILYFISKKSFSKHI